MLYAPVARRSHREALLDGSVCAAGIGVRTDAALLRSGGRAGPVGADRGRLPGLHRRGLPAPAAGAGAQVSRALAGRDQAVSCSRTAAVAGVAGSAEGDDAGEAGAA